MGVLDILNVGQGDCMVIRPTPNCMHSGRDIFVDLGPGNVDVSRYIQKDDIAIFITHHHADHLDGIKYFYSIFNNISEIILPYYQNEISLIARAILNLKGINSAKNCNYFKSMLQAAVSNQNFLLHIFSNRGPRISFAYEGMKYCDHIEVLNPPVHPQCNSAIYDISLKEFQQIFHELFVSNFAEDLTRYVDFSKRKYLFDDPISTHFIRIQPENEDRDLIHQKIYVVLDFIVQNMYAMYSFNAKPTQTNLKTIYSNYVACTHDYCTVLKLNYGDETFLLTADASKKVFSRLIKEKKYDLRADYLKVPHHGSKGNLSNSILNAVKPRVAIISHDNGLFGRATDPHPNREVLNMLNNNNIDILVTNDVVKDDTVVVSKSNNKKYKNVTIIG